jgi:NDP-sugar pyrophosphorylase family protein
MQAVILAGGKGTRLKPFTNAIPKPLVPIGDMPILEVILKQLKRDGVTEVVIAVNHLAQLIMAFFGDGSRYGLKIRYSMEDQPLGTAGPLKLIEGLEDSFLVMNGDLLTTLSFSDLAREHARTEADLTISTYKKEVKIDLGVLRIEEGSFREYIEKPTYYFDVSMGIYMMNHAALDYIPAGQAFDLPDLVRAMSAAGRSVKCYSANYYWLDIGRVDDYETAVEIFESRKAEFLERRI